MANKGLANISVTALRDEIKMRLNGTLPYNPSSGDYWVYKTSTAPTTPATIFVATDEFVGNIRTSDSVAVTDKVKWIAIKNLGYTGLDGGTKSNEAIMMNFSGVSPTYNGTDGDDANNMFIGPGELFVVKLNGVLVEDLKIGTCKLTAGMPSAIGSDTVSYLAAAVIQDL
jgi:hypothetical protein